MEGLIEEYKKVNQIYKQAAERRDELMDELWRTAEAEAFTEWKAKHKLDKVVGMRLTGNSTDYATKSVVLARGRMKTDANETFVVEWYKDQMQFNVDDELVYMGPGGAPKLISRKRPREVVSDLWEEAQRAQKAREELAEMRRTKLSGIL